MKLTAILLFVTIMQVSAVTYAQKITLNQNKVSIKQVFKEIKKQTGYDVFYLPEMLDPNQSINANFKDTPVEQVIDKILEGHPLTYTIDEKTIVIKKKEEPSLLDKLRGALTPSPPDEIKGIVKNKAGEPMAGASITIKRTGLGAVTDARGTFILKNVKTDDILIISFIGYSTLTVDLQKTGKAGDNYNFELTETTNPLDQVVIQAYGETSQRLATGDIATISAKEIEKQPVLNPLLALQGRMAGVDVQQTSGYASAPVNVTIRGLTNVDGTVTDPLYVIDGVPLTVVQVGGSHRDYRSGTSGFLQNGLNGPANGESPLFNINPADIESISVLKDADATSIYGSRGANGVILITTKKGKTGDIHFDAHVEEGYSRVTKFYDLLNTPEYLEMRREAFRNDGITPNVGNAPDLLLWDPNRYTDWQKELYGKLAANNNTQVSLSGGSAQTTFRIAGNYSYNTAVTSVGGDRKAGLSFNLTHRAINDKFSVSLSAQYAYSLSNMISLPGRISFAPNAPSIYNPDGTLNWADWRSGGGNPFISLLQPYSAQTHLLTSNLNLKYQIARGLSASVNFGYNDAQTNQTQLIPIASQDPSGNPTGSSLFGNNNNKNWLIEPQITYGTSIWRGKLSLLAGGSAQGNTTDGIALYGFGYTNDALLRTISNAVTEQAYDNYGQYRYASVFGRVNYNIDDTYIVNFTFRRDGSSNYGPGNQYGTFAALGGAWLFTNEQWFKDHVSFLSLGKLRASYGSAGSDGGKPYGYLTRWSSESFTPYEGIQPLAPTQHANPDYHWQINHKFEIAADLGFFKDWVTATIAYYRNRTTDQLLSYPTPDLSGFNTVLENLPALVQNKGWEFTIGGKGVNTPYFQWAPAFNFSFNQNKFVSFPGLGGTNYFLNGAVGQPLNGVYLLHFTGVDPQTGQYTYQDANHDGRITTKPISQGGDMFFKKITPAFQTGFGFNSGFKGLKLSLFFSVKKQTGVNALEQGRNPGLFGYNQPVEVLGRWQYPGQVSNTGKFSTINAQDPQDILGSSDIGYTDASYIRLQNAALSYDLPSSIAKKLGMTSFRIFIHATDLFTITGYKGIDPETQVFGSLPPVKTIVGGLAVSF